MGGPLTEIRLIRRGDHYMIKHPYYPKVIRWVKRRDMATKFQNEHEARRMWKLACDSAAANGYHRCPESVTYERLQ